VPRYWVAVASKDHVARGVEGGFAQVAHGKRVPLERMAAGDLIAYYSGKLRFADKVPCRAFTAIGRVTGDDVYQHDMGNGFLPFRRNIDFFDAKEAPIEPLIERLSFIKDKRRWGYPLRRGYFEIAKDDFEVIARAMGTDVDRAEA
jgi:EVE domain